MDTILINNILSFPVKENAIQIQEKIDLIISLSVLLEYSFQFDSNLINMKRNNKYENLNEIVLFFKKDKIHHSVHFYIKIHSVLDSMIYFSPLDNNRRIRSWKDEFDFLSILDKVVNSL